jgi:hypothetical protein
MSHEGLPPSYEDATQEPGPPGQPELEAFVLSATGNESDARLLINLGVRCLSDLLLCSRGFLAENGMKPFPLERLMTAIDNGPRASAAPPGGQPGASPPADLESYLAANGMKKYRHVLRSKGVTSLGKFSKLSRNQIQSWVLEADVVPLFGLVLALHP